MLVEHIVMQGSDHATLHEFVPSLDQQLALNVDELRKEGRSEQYIAGYIRGWHSLDRVKS
jgi:hypothetical protein